jgi:hypothetical protein
LETLLGFLDVEVDELLRVCLRQVHALKQLASLGSHLWIKGVALRDCELGVALRCPCWGLLVQ